MLNRDRPRRKRVRTATRRLWENLCEAHRLTFAERRLLKRVARDLGMANPLVLFFRPSAFAAYLQDREHRLSEARREQVQCLARILFADCLPVSRAAGGPVGDDGLPHSIAPDERMRRPAGKPLFRAP